MVSKYDHRWQLRDSLTVPESAVVQSKSQPKSASGVPPLEVHCLGASYDSEDDADSTKGGYAMLCRVGDVGQSEVRLTDCTDCTYCTD